MALTKEAQAALDSIMNKYKGTETVRKDITKTKKKAEVAQKMKSSKASKFDPMVDFPNGKRRRMPRYW